jgi:hypothetical protein
VNKNKSLLKLRGELNSANDYPEAMVGSEEAQPGTVHLNNVSKFRLEGSSLAPAVDRSADMQTLH